MADDYATRIAAGEQETRGMMSEALGKVTGMPNVQFCYGTPALNISFCPFSVTHNSFYVLAYNNMGQSALQTLRIPIAGTSATVTRVSNNAGVQSQILPLSQRELELSLLYLQFDEQKDPARVAQLTNNATHVVTFNAKLPAMGFETYKITWSAEEPKAASSPMSEAIVSPRPGQAAASHTTTKFSAPTTTIQNDYYQVTLDQASGTTAQVKNLKTGVTAQVAIDIGFYNSSEGGCTYGLDALNKAYFDKQAEKKRAKREEFEYGMDAAILPEDPGYGCDGQKSGAYIFRPNSSAVFPAACTTQTGCNTVPTFSVTTGPLVSEATITFADWATVVIRLVMGQPRVEVEYTVGPIPQENFEGGSSYLQGKEVVLRYNTSLSTKGVFYADSNAREMVQRVYNQRGPAYPNPYPITEPAAGNYYPVNALLALEDTNANVGFSVAVDRSVGGASLADGELELMVHRRTEDDDSRGVGQPMNETMCGCRDQDPNHIGQCGCVGLVIKGTNYLFLDTIPNTNAARRTGSELLNFDSVVAFSTGAPSVTANFSGLGSELPPNVKLMTFGVISPQYNNDVYLRLSHLFEAGEHPTLSQPVNVSLTSIFNQKGLTIQSAKEVSLTGNQTPQQVAAEAYKWKVAGEEVQMPKTGQVVGAMVPFDPKAPGMVVNLRPMDIRTFVVTVA